VREPPAAFALRGGAAQLTLGEIVSEIVSQEAFVTEDRHGKQLANESRKRSIEPVVVVKENRVAHGALERLANADRESAIGVVYLYGPSGVGKSHLVRQFVRDAQRHHPNLRLRNSTASEFAAALNEAQSRHRQSEFETECAALELLILEDLGGIQGRMSAQRMLVVLMDELKRTGGRMIVTCTSLPGQLKNVIPRLVSRLRGGLCIPLELLDESSRQSFARHLAASRQIPLPPQAAELLAQKGLTTPRELLAALLNFDFGVRRKRDQPNSKLEEASIGSHADLPDRSLALIAKTVANFYSLPVSQLRSSARLKRSVLARQVAMLLSREFSRKSAAAIARFFGRKNHTTVVHACRRTRALVAADPTLAHDLERMRQTLRHSGL
jgi:chromosomal replication initiator protein